MNKARVAEAARGIIQVKQRFALLFLEDAKLTVSIL